MSRPTPHMVAIFAPTAAPFFSNARIERIGGAETQLYYMASMLADRGIHVRVLTIRVENRARTPSPLVSIRNVWTSSSLFPVKALGLARHVAGAPSPIYIRAPSVAGAIVVLIGRVLGKRVVLGLASDLTCIRHKRALRRNLITWTVLKLSSQVIAQTTHQQRLLRRNFGVESVVFHNVIRKKDYSTARAVPFGDRDIDVVWIGTIEPRKGLEQLIEVTERVPNRRFAVIGGPRPDSREYYIRFLTTLDGRPNVVAPGFVEPHLVPNWLARAKLLLHTSGPVAQGLTKEGFPNVFLEAWASGLPVVSLHADPDALIASGGLGYKCESVEEAAAVIERTTRDETRWESTRKKADAFVDGRDTANPAVQNEFLSILSGLPAETHC